MTTPVGPAAAALALALACTGPAPPGPPANRPPVQVQLLALNDFPGNLEPPSGSTGAIDGTPAGGVERRATLLTDLSAENGTSNTITVAAGDLIGVSPRRAVRRGPLLGHLGARRHRAHRRSAGRRQRHLPHHREQLLADGGDGFSGCCDPAATGP
jgi:hypothetical protein